MENRDNVQNVRLTTEQKKELISQWKQSGISRKKFSAEHQINYYTFMDWCYRFDKKPAQKKVTNFVELKVSSQPGSFAEIKFTNGSAIVFYQPVTADYFQSLLKK